MDLLGRMSTFVRIVDGGSLSGAARALRLSLPAVSRQLNALERELGVSLVVRSTRRLRVTPAGLRWYAHCQRILREIDAARAELGGAEVAGRLVVSAPITFSMAHVVPRVPELLQRHPKLVLELRLEDRLADLVGETVDVAIRGGVPPPDSTGLVAHPLLEFDRVLVAAPAYLRRRRPPREPRDLATHTCLVQDGGRGPLSTWELTHGDRRHAITVPSGPSSNAPLALVAWARAGMGIGLLPEWLVRDDLAGGRLRRVLPGWSAGAVTVWALHRVEQRGSARVRAFLDVLAGQAEIPAGH
jgi:DNA-binding transcriptional LysR family regulator